MQSKRTNEIRNKPKAFNWLKNNPSDSLLLLEVLNRLNISYLGDNSGYVDFEPPQYRYNDKRFGEYTIVSARADGSVKVELMLGDGTWRPFDLSKFSDLDKVISYMESNLFESFVFSQDNYESAFDQQVQRSLESNSLDRKKRLEKASRKPTKFLGIVSLYKRNPDVVAEVLARAGDKCEACGGKAPFNRRTDGSPFLEVHHKMFLSAGGEDTVDNAVAICPNCHREKHFG